MFFATGIFEQAAFNGFTLSIVEFATFMTNAPRIISDVINLDDLAASVRFAVSASCIPNFSVQDCLDTFTNPNSASASFVFCARNPGLCIGIGIIVNTCFEIPQCEAALLELANKLFEGGVGEFREFLMSIAPEIFEENFDSELMGWSQSLCSIHSGQECLPLQQRTETQGGTPPSPPNWGFVGVNDFVPGCDGEIQNRFAKTVTVATADTFDVSATLGANTCDVCTESARVFIDGNLILDAQGTTLVPFTPRPSSQFKQATINLDAGDHAIEIGMHSNFACFSEFAAYFDDITIKHSEGVPTSLSLSVGPFFRLELELTTVDVARPSIVTVPLQVIWIEGHQAQPVTVDVIDVNATSISHSVTSISNSKNKQLFDIVFDTPADMQVGKFPFVISVKEVESEDRVGVAIILNVQ